MNELTPRAQLADAVNTIIRREGELIGDNTDGVGLLTDLTQNLGLRLASPRILMLGAGGAARGTLEPLLELKPSTLVIANRTAERAIEPGRRVRRSRRGQRCRVRRHRTAGAVRPDHQRDVREPERRSAADPVARRGRNTTCYNMAYGIGETPFAQWARDHGAAVVAQGWGVLVEQAAEAFRIWRGVRPSTPPVLEALRARATSLAAARTRS